MKGGRKKANKGGFLAFRLLTELEKGTQGQKGKEGNIMAKGKENVKKRKKELRIAIDTLRKLSDYEEVSSSEILRNTFDELELELRREFMEPSTAKEGKKEG